MVKNALHLAIMLLFASYAAIAQHQDTTRSEVQEDLERALEDFDPSDPNFTNERLTQFLQDLAANPININSAQVDELLIIPGIDLKRAQSIVAYRKKIKPFENIEELKEVSGLGAKTFEKARPYVTLGSGLDLGKTLFADYRYWTAGDKVEIFSRYQQTLQQQEGYIRKPDEGGYVGSPVKYYQRMRYRSDHLSTNITQEKDPGEPFEGTVGLDFFSWHFALENIGKLQDLVIGDYGLSFGQGLILWDGGAFGKGREVIGTVNRNARGVSPYASSQETDFYRGLAATYGGKLQLTGFYSYRKRTASEINGDTTGFPQNDGFHRTIREREQFNNMRQELYGGNIRAELPFGFIGATGYKTVFNKFIYGGNAIYDRYDFSGISTSAVGIDYNFLLASTLIYGEVGRSENNGYGVISGITSPVGDKTEMTLTYRNYGKDFQSILGDGFGEGSGDPRNEEGLYLGLCHNLNANFTLSGYFDQFRFPSPRFGTRQPTQGYDWLGLLEIEINRNLELYIQVRSETKDDEYESFDNFGRLERKLGLSKRTALRIHLEHWVNKRVRLRSRGEIIQSQKAGESVEYGYLIYQDIRFIGSRKWKLDTRVTVFETESFDTRVYQFENDLLYVLSNEVLFGQGQRLYVLLNYQPMPFMEVWAKFGITIFEDQLTIGSGLNEIKGNSRSDLGFQIRLLF